MMNHIANRISFWEPNRVAGVGAPALQAGRPAIMVGIQRDLCPPLLFGDNRLQRMRVIVVAPSETFPCDERDAGDARAESLAEVLPLLPSMMGFRRPGPFQPRPVLGEILRGENGAFYERFGNRIRPLRHLVSGPSGEVLEVTEVGEAPPRLRARVSAPPRIEQPPEVAEVEPEPPDAAATPSAPTRAPESEGESVSREAASRYPTFRPLLPEPGQWRVVRLADFKSLLVPQLAHPERLRDSHRLPCYVQVFEIGAPQRIERLAEAIFGDATATADLPPLTAAVVQALQLAPLLPAPGRAPRRAPRQPGMLLPYDRVFTLELANDPTEGTSPPNPDAGAAKTAEPTRSDLPQVALVPGPNPSRTPANDPIASTPNANGGPNPCAVSPTPAAPAVPLSVAARKTSIPAPFLKPWEFRLSREEALYDLSEGRTWFGALGRWFRRLAGSPRFRRECRRWQVLLSGKTLDEQLWSVRPPSGGARHPFIREWARGTLELAGYDSQVMLTEWEVFWRRKET